MRLFILFSLLYYPASLVLHESRSVWASHPAGGGDVGAHSWEHFERIWVGGWVGGGGPEGF